MAPVPTKPTSCYTSSPYRRPLNDDILVEAANPFPFPWPESLEKAVQGIIRRSEFEINGERNYLASELSKTGITERRCGGVKWQRSEYNDFNECYDPAGKVRRRRISLSPRAFFTDGQTNDLVLLFTGACALTFFVATIVLWAQVGSQARIRGCNCAEISSQADATSEYVHLPSWTLPFCGSEFRAYTRLVDLRIDEYRKTGTNRSEILPTCHVPLFTGEFGYEMAAMVPWAYSKHQSDNCHVITEGVVGTKYLYYFSHVHTTINYRYVEKYRLQLMDYVKLFPHIEKVKARRRYEELPEGNPFNGSVHVNDMAFPKRDWMAPTFKDFYRRNDLVEGLDKPVFVIFNKYTEEWGKKPVNFIPIPELHQILNYLSPKYHVVYIRLERKELDDDSQSCKYGDKTMIRDNFPKSVVILDDLTKDLSPDEVNLMIFSLCSMSNSFVSVQGGNSVIASFFGGRNIIMAKTGQELGAGDYTYYHRFSNATIEVAHDEHSLLNLIKLRY